MSTAAQRGVGIGAALSIAFSKYATFKGRASRSEYWWFALGIMLISMAVGIVGSLLGPTIGGGLISLWTLAYFLPSLAVGVRRLHDTNRSGWWWLLTLIPGVGFILLIIFFAQAPVAEGVRFE